MSGTSIVQRGKRFAVVAYAGVDPATKRKRRKWFSGFHTRKEAEQFRLNLAHHPSFSAGEGPYGSPRLRTADYMDAWLQERVTLGKIRERTARRHGEHIHLHLNPRLGHIPLTRLSPPAIQSVYVSLLSDSLSAATVRRAASVLHTALNDAMHRGLISRNPADNTTRPAAPKYEPTILPEEQVLAYLDEARKMATPALHALYTTVATTGMRIGELLGVPETAMDLPRRLLHVRQTLICAGWHPVFGEPKMERDGGQSRCPTWPPAPFREPCCGRRSSDSDLARGSRTPACFSAGPEAIRSSCPTCTGATISRGSGVSACRTPGSTISATSTPRS